MAIFRNPALIGETTINFKEETVVIRHQAILDEATFQAITAVLDGHRLREPRGTVLYALRGIAYCKCGAKFEPLNNGRRYYRCKARCGEKLWRKDELEYEVAEAFTRYLEDRERWQDYLLLAQKSADGLRQDLAEVNKALQRNKSEWTMLLQKDLGGYPTDIVEGAKTGLQAEAQALERQKCRIEADLAALPQVDPAEVERELMALAEPWALASGDGRINAGAQHVMSWERRSPAAGTWRQDAPHKLFNDEAQLLRERLLRVDARVIVQRLGIRISGRLSLRGSAKARPLSTI